MSELDGAVRLAIAALIGLGVGIEREWTVHAGVRAARFAGLRTFLMIGVIGGCGGLLLGKGHAIAGSLVIAGGMGLSIAAYVVTAGKEGGDLDGTTEVAALIVVALGALAGVGMLALAAGAGAMVVLVLSEKERLHGAVQLVREAELRAAVRFSVLALVVLPLLPEGPLAGPLQIRPRALWMIVLLFCALNFAAFIARRAADARHGYGVVGMLGGLISSTAVTLEFARRSRRETELAPSLASGVVGACTVLVPRVAIVSAVLNATVALHLLAFLAPAALVGALFIARDWRRETAGVPEAKPAGANPLRLAMAVRMAVLFQVALSAVDYVRSIWTTTGLFATAAALGLTDVDALTVAMSKPGEPLSADIAARAITIGILTNTAFKLVLAAAIGGPAFRPGAVGGLTAIGFVTAVMLWVL